jgi:hypothetical protein
VSADSRDRDAPSREELELVVPLIPAPDREWLLELPPREAIVATTVYVVFPGAKLVEEEPE